MRYCNVVLVLCIPLFSISQAPSADDKEKFFNGKDLTGWDGLPAYWSVKDGAIVKTFL